MAADLQEGDIAVVIDGQTEERDGASTLNGNSESEALRRISRDPELSQFLQEWEKHLESAAAAAEREPAVQVESDDVNPIEVEAQCLLQIDNDPKLKLVLKEWEKRFEVASLRIEKKSSRTINAKNELYQLIGFYSVFQGVVLTAVAQTSLIRCSQSWGPALLSLCASVATIAIVYNKLQIYSQLRSALKEETDDSKVWQGHIRSLKETGTEFNFPQPEESRKKSTGLEPVYKWAVLLSLLFFSAVTLASCFVVLCNRKSTSTGGN